MMWIKLAWEPVTTFELRPSNTTKTGGKSLLVPTPYALRMAMLDRLIRLRGLQFGKDIFPIVRDAGILMHPPLAMAVNRTFQKILRPPFKNGEWTSTIAMREFCQQVGWLEIILAVPDDAADDLVAAAIGINYFGQRGSFYQLVQCEEADHVPESFIDVTQPSANFGPGYLQRMDDMLPEATFDDVNVYNPRAKGGRHSYNVILPYQLAHHAANHTVWERNGVSP